MNFDLMRSLLIDRALRGELFSNSNSIAAEEKTLNEVKETPFTIPNNWQWKRVADCVQFNPKVIQDDAAEVSFIPMADVEPGFVDHCSTRQIKLWAKVKKGFSRFQEGDLLVAKITPCFQNRKSCVANNLISGTGAGSTEFHVMRCVSDVDAKFLLYFFKSEYFIRYGVNHFNGTVGQQRVGAQDIKDCLIPVPPFDEQTRIVEKLEEAFAEIARAEKAYEELQTLAGVLRGQILQEAIKGKLVPQRAEEGVVEQIGSALDEVPFTIPSSWKWQKVIEIAKVMGGKRVPAGAKLIEENTGYPYIRVSDMKNGGVDTSGLLYLTEDCREKIKRYTISCNDIYVTVAGTIGRVGIIPEELDGANLTENADKIVLNTDSVIRDWLLLVLSSKYCQTVFRERKTKVGQPKLAIKRIESIMIPVPPVEEQRLVVSKVEELMIQVDALLS